MSKEFWKKIAKEKSEIDATRASEGQRVIEHQRQLQRERDQRLAQEQEKAIRRQAQIQNEGEKSRLITERVVYTMVDIFQEIEENDPGVNKAPAHHVQIYKPGDIVRYTSYDYCISDWRVRLEWGNKLKPTPREQRMVRKWGGDTIYDGMHSLTPAIFVPNHILYFDFKYIEVIVDPDRKELRLPPKESDDRVPFSAFSKSPLIITPNLAERICMPLEAKRSYSRREYSTSPSISSSPGISSSNGSRDGAIGSP